MAMAAAAQAPSDDVLTSAYTTARRRGGPTHMLVTDLEDGNLRVSVEVIADDRVGLEEKVALDNGATHIVDAEVVRPGVVAKCLERVIDGGISLGSEPTFGLLDDEPGVQRLLSRPGMSGDPVSTIRARSPRPTAARRPASRQSGGRRKRNSDDLGSERPTKGTPSGRGRATRFRL